MFLIRRCFGFREPSVNFSTINSTPDTTASPANRGWLKGRTFQALCCFFRRKPTVDAESVKQRIILAEKNVRAVLAPSNDNAVPNNKLNPSKAVKTLFAELQGCMDKLLILGKRAQTSGEYSEIWELDEKVLKLMRELKEDVVDQSSLPVSKWQDLVAVWQCKFQRMLVRLDERCVYWIELYYKGGNERMRAFNNAVGIAQWIVDHDSGKQAQEMSGFAKGSTFPRLVQLKAKLEEEEERAELGVSAHRLQMKPMSLRPYRLAKDKYTALEDAFKRTYHDNLPSK
ncbi:hypothetical protein [Rugamonas aquatica]|uniref:Uncharacterized protein n=1 Tax=Rugamonas aquatica TaxID=2743357 RepID=A0A6A7N7M9_9BURK|nr:hypothetical protein [Rugamonas aquatica]MQA40747.1 hypothetical protein [Rugamonas aquatica]